MFCVKRRKALSSRCRTSSPKAARRRRPSKSKGRLTDVMESQRQHNAAIAQIPVTAEMLNALTLEKRIAWMMNIFTTDERYACAWNIAEKAMKAAPISFPLAIEQVWQKRATKNW